MGVFQKIGNALARLMYGRNGVDQLSLAIVVGSLVLDADAMEITQGEQEIPVTTREFNIMFKLLSYPNHTFSRSQLMDDGED